MSDNEKKKPVKSRTGIRRARRGKGLPRIMWVAIAICVIGSVLIFRDQGSDVPTGIGEYQTVVTAPDEAPAPQGETTPRSGDVDISGHSQDVTPETPDGSSASQTTAPVKPQANGSQDTPVKPATTKPAVKAPPPAPVKPSANGPYLVQTGSFGDGANADKEAVRLQDLGYDARVKMGNTSDDSIIYRVRIGYFQSRAEAETFIRQNRKHMPSAIPAHR